MNKIFLCGTCADTTWRKDLMLILDKYNIGYIDPVVSDWTPVCKLLEDINKDVNCDVHLYVLTSEMTGVYSIAEATQSSNDPDVTTIVQVMPEGFDKGQLKSLTATLDLLKSNGAYTLVSNDINDTAKVILSLK